MMGKKIALVVVLVAILAAWLIFNGEKQVTNASPQSSAQATKVKSDSTVSGGARIMFPEDNFNFGTIKQDTTVEHVFTVKNGGDSPLNLIKAAAS